MISSSLLLKMSVPYRNRTYNRVLGVQPFRSYEFISMATIRSYQSSNDNTIFLLDYLYYIVHEVGCRWFFDHYLLYFTHILLYIER